jgi:hypothetical protein
LRDEGRFCIGCGAAISISAQAQAVNTDGRLSGEPQLVGFSTKINDPSFHRYSKSTKRWEFIFSLILAIVPVVGFPIYGSVSGEIELPYSLYYGMGVSALFVAIAIVLSIRMNRDVTWDGIVVNKKSSRKREGDNLDGIGVEYMEYKLVVKKNNGKVIEDVSRNNPVIYDYYNIGDRVRHHKGFHLYEKYDKSRDASILCIACLAMNDIRKDWCTRCKCALLK